MRRLNKLFVIISEYGPKCAATKPNFLLLRCGGRLRCSRAFMSRYTVFHEFHVAHKELDNSGQT